MTHHDDIQPIEYIAPDQPGGIAGWHEGIPVVRILTCGLFAIEILQEVPEGDPSLARYEALPASQLRAAGTAPACHLLKLLCSRPQRYGSKDWLRTHLREDEEQSITTRRLENIVSVLRRLVRLPGGQRLQDWLTYERATAESGDGYRLAGYPLVWLDVDALSWNVQQACLKERFADDPFVYWQRAYALASRGSFLPDELHSAWAEKRRAEVEDHLRQSVQALARLWLARFGPGAEEDVLRMLRAYRREHLADEDLLRPLLELLAKRGCYNEVLESYEQLEQALLAQGLTRDGQERMPHRLTEEIVEYARLKLRERATAKSGEEDTLPHTISSSILVSPDETFSHFSHAITQGIIEGMKGVRNQERSEPRQKQVTKTSFSPPFLLTVQDTGNTPIDSDRAPYLLSNEGSPSIEGASPLFELAMQRLQMVVREDHWSDDEISSRVERATEDFMSKHHEALGISRRTAVTLLLGSSGAILAIPAMRSLAPVAEEILSFCATNIAVCWQYGKGNGQEMLVAQSLVSSYLPVLTALAQHSSPYQKSAADQAAQCYRLKAILGYHLDNLAVAEENAKKAVSYSRRAGNPNLLVTSLVLHALISYYANRPEKALRACREASTSLDEATPSVQSYFYRTQAACLAQLGQESSALESMDLAYEQFSQSSADEASFVHAAPDHFENFLWNGITRYHLGHYDVAFRLLEQVDPLNTETLLPERVRTGFLNHLVLTELRMPAQQRDMERCIATWTTAMQRAINLKSELRFDEASRAYSDMQVAFPNESRINQLRGAMKRWD